MARKHTRFLLTEGRDDQYAIAGLMANHVSWGAGEEAWPVKIEAAGSMTELLNRDYLTTSLKRPALEALGIVLDANDCMGRRWSSLRETFRTAGVEFPDAPVPGGLICRTDRGANLGVWIMPDNSSPGMLETFLCSLLPDGANELWAHAREATAKAKDLGAPFKEAHVEKANIRAWLSWQDPPGRPFGEALKAKCLDPHSPAALPFVEWFAKLFGLTRQEGGCSPAS